MLTPRQRLDVLSKRLLDEALDETTPAEEAQRKLRLREEIESHLLAVDTLVEIGATGQSVSRVLSKLSHRLGERQPA